MVRLLRGSCASLAAGVLVGTIGASAAGAAPARYEIQAWTLSGLGAAAAGGGLSGAAMMRLLMGGEPSAARSLQLTLRADGSPPANPQADHSIPAGLGLGASLSLLTPTASTGPSPGAPGSKDATLPQGRLLVFRGCAEGKPSLEPEVLDFARLVPDQQAIARALARSGSLPTNAESGRSRTGVVGHWPHGASSPAIPTQGSLVGSHRVTSNYAPEIAFAVDRNHDFLPAVQLRTSPAGEAWRLSWQPIPTVLGYQALVTGPGRQEGDVVIWTSSERSWSESPMLGAFSLASEDGASLVRQGVLMAPDRTSCTVSAAVMQQMQAGVLHFSAFGAPLLLDAPGVNPAWQVHLDRQAMVIQPLVEGLPSSPGEGGADSGESDPPGGGGGSPFNLFRGFF
ncbi:MULTISPECIES: hypothetical protein [Aphanothece]|uniref:hypothetical protein n=1 Tax=Aphanothece TaxID=1121 RepID=UPI0039855A87